MAAKDIERFERGGRRVGAPDLPRHAALPEDHTGDRPPVREVEEVGVHPLMAVEVGAAEPHLAVGAWVAVGPDEAQALVVAQPRRARDSSGRDRAVSTASAGAEVLVFD